MTQYLALSHWQVPFMRTVFPPALTAVLLLAGFLQMQAASPLPGLEPLAQAVQDGVAAAESAPVPETAAKQDPAAAPAVAAESTRQAAGPREVRLRLWDGTIVTGDLGRDSLHVRTRFGLLEVPVADIVVLTPGLRSLPELRQKLDGWIEQLGDRDFQVRQQSMQNLLAVGPRILEYLGSVGDGGSAERKKNLLALTEQLQELQDDSENGIEVGTPPPLGMEDSLATAEFVIVGEIEEQEFEVTTRFGVLAVRLGDIEQADRTWMLQASTVRRTVEIGARDFFQTSPQETGVRVHRGDRIQIRASGNVSWVSWGNIASSPEGINNQGQWESMNCGMLAARIGKSGPYIPVGSEETFVAEQDGEILLGVAMNDNLANQQGYEWTGSYKARITVTSGSRE